MVAAALSISAARQGGKSASKPAQAQGVVPQQTSALRLEVSSDESRLISLRARNAPLAEIAAELARKLRLPVSLSPLMQKQRATLKIEALPLETALPLLAPHAYVDYVVSGGSLSPSRPAAIYLHAINERPPSDSIALKDRAQTVIIEGDTESIGEPTGERSKSEAGKPLRFSLENNRLNIFARKQPLSAIMYEITSKLGIPLDVQYDSGELIDVDYKGPSLEDAVRTSLPPTVQLYLRADLLTRESSPILVTLIAPAKTVGKQK